MHKRRSVAIVLGFVVPLLTACGGGGSDQNQNQTNGNNVNEGSRCGNGILEGAEECDDGPSNSDSQPNACRTTCFAAHCGDGVEDDGELCDEGPANSDEVPDACRANCTPPGCGDGVVDIQHGESCDDGNTADNDGCSAVCDAEYCGNGLVEDGEVCDDGNTSSGDGCSADCESEETCGNGVVDVIKGEQCDCGDGTVPTPSGCSGPNLDAQGSDCKTNCKLPGCGDGVAEGAEQCDGTDLAGASCGDFGFYLGGTLSCTAACGFDTSECLGFCGDRERNGPEQCDATDLGNVGCDDLGFYGGDLACTGLCAFDTSGCTEYCGDGTINGPEQCDGSELASASCTSFGYYGGTLKCSSGCGFDTSGCENYCGDGTVNGPEQCEPTVAITDTDCTDFGFYGGTLKCSSGCGFDTSSCKQYCGDGSVNGSEQCEPTVTISGTDCTDFGFYTGTLGCSSTCTFDTSSCHEWCGDDQVNGTEQCEPNLGVGSVTCSDYGFYEGDLTCSSRCAYDTSGCDKYCGDDLVNGPEDCEPTVTITGTDCTDFGFYTGTLACNDGCNYDTSGCHLYCGDGTRNGPEACDGAPPPGQYCLDMGYDVGALGCTTYCTPGFDGCGLIGFVQQPDPEVVTYSGVWVASGGEVFAVYDGETTEMLHFNNTEWVTEDLGGTYTLTDVWGRSESEVYAVGTAGTMLVWNGASWAPFTPAPTTNETLHAVHGNKGRLVVVGDNDTVLVYTGGAWTTESPLGSGVTYRDAWMAPGNQLFVVGVSGTAPSQVGEIGRWLNSTWYRYTPVASPMEFNGVWGLAGNDVYAVGMDGTIVHWNGSSWSEESVASGVPQSLLSVWADSSGRIFVGGEHGELKARINGHWLSLDSDTGQNLYAVSGNDSDTVLVAGSGGALMQYQGRAWSQQEGTAPGLTLLQGIWGAAPDAVFAVGQNHLLKFTGETWLDTNDTDLGTTFTMNAVAGSADDDVYAVGTDGTGYYYNGSSWQSLIPLPASPPPPTFMAAAMAPDGWLYAAGTNGFVMRRNTPSGPWPAPMDTLGHTETLMGITAPAADHVVAVGDGVILHYDGTNWSEMALPAWTLMAVHGTAWNDLYAVGKNGVIVHYDGNVSGTWTEMVSPTTEELNAVWAFSDGEVFASGASGTLLHYDGSIWTPVRSDMDDPIFGLWGMANEALFFASGTGSVTHLIYEIAF